MTKFQFFLVFILFQAPLSFSQQWDFMVIKNEHEVFIDGSKSSGVFEGFGSLSAGASTRLLYDYTEPYRSEILDYLFKPNFGANLHHLKVEIGGDVNSTDGSEPSFAATRDEFENPIPGYFKRGYEYWLMSEAVKRNPEIILEGLQWGAPGWVGNGNFYSEDNARFIVQWIKGAKKFWNLDIDYVGIWNERLYDIEYIKLLRKTLDENGLEGVMIDAGDLFHYSERWLIANDILKDPELDKSVAVINAHTPEHINFLTSENVKKLTKPVWSGESHFFGNNWYTAAKWARAYRSYITGGISKVINWSLITSYHNYLMAPRSGIMMANEPWSGHYAVKPSIWALAHINQFAKPEWKYLDTGCKWWASEGSLYEGHSVITLKSPDTDDYSIIIETMDAKEPQILNIKLSEDLSARDLAVFRSVFNAEEFIQQPDQKLENREFTIQVFPNSIYSLTTTRGQKKGLPKNKIPESAEHPLNYSNDFESQELHSPATYFSDQHGTFEVVQRPDNKGKCLKQISTMPGICWRCEFKNPLSFFGDINWQNYRISADFMLPDSGEVMFIGRARDVGNFGGEPFAGYNLHFQADGTWILKIENGETLTSGKIKNYIKKWHSLELIFINDNIEIIIDKKQKYKVVDKTYDNGIIAIGTGWNVVYFDNIVIGPVQVL